MNGTYRSAFAANYNAPWTPPSHMQSGTQTLVDGESYKEIYLNAEAPSQDLTVTLNGTTINSVYAVIESNYYSYIEPTIWNGSVEDFAASMENVAEMYPFERSNDYKIMLDCYCGYVQIGGNKVSVGPGQYGTSTSGAWFVFATQDSAPAIVNVYYEGENGGDEPSDDTCPSCGGSGVCGSCGGSGEVEGETCGECGGSGVCPSCNGTGITNNSSSDEPGGDGYYDTCPSCGGTGECQECNGSGECPNCGGTGTDPETGETCYACNGSGTCQSCGGNGVCPSCYGDGQIWVDNGGGGDEPTYDTCPTCGGTGADPETVDTCPTCSGSGQIQI